MRQTSLQRNDAVMQVFFPNKHEHIKPCEDIQHKLSLRNSVLFSSIKRALERRTQGILIRNDCQIKGHFGYKTNTRPNTNHKNKKMSHNTISKIHD
jgi:hypothetical protein